MKDLHVCADCKYYNKILVNDRSVPFEVGSCHIVYDFRLLAFGDAEACDNFESTKEETQC